MTVTYGIALMLVLFLMLRHIGPGSPICVECGKRIGHAPDCRTQHRGGDDAGCV
jgi:hypothetical protein